MGEVQLICCVLCTGDIALIDFVQRNTHARMVLRRTAVIEILGPARESERGKRKEGNDSPHLKFLRADKQTSLKTDWYGREWQSRIIIIK